MKRIVIAFLFFGLLSFGCITQSESNPIPTTVYPPNTQSVDTSNMTQYSNPAYGISFYYPNDWDLTPEYMKNISTNSFNFNQYLVAMYKQNNPDVNMDIMPMQDNGTTEYCTTNVQACDNAIEQQILPLTIYYQKINSGVEVVSGKNAYFHIHDIVLKSQNVLYVGQLTNITTSQTEFRQKQVIVSNNNIAYVITFTSPTAIYDQNNVDFDKMLSTLEFTG